MAGRGSIEGCIVGAGLLPFLARLLRTARAVREDRGDLDEDDVAVHAGTVDDELDDIEDEEEE